jgi:hypothetical protein
VERRGLDWLTIGRVEVAAVVLAALAGIYSLATSDQASVRLAIVVLAPTLEAALPLAARVAAPGRRHSARVIAALLVAFYVAFAPIGIDNYLYLPAVVALLTVIVMSNRERWREIRSRGDARR